MQARRPVEVVLHVVGPHPDQLDRRPGHLLRDGDRLRDEVVLEPPPEAAADELRARCAPAPASAGRCRRGARAPCGNCVLAQTSTPPRDTREAVLRLERRVREHLATCRCASSGFARPRDRLHVAGLLRDVAGAAFAARARPDPSCPPCAGALVPRIPRRRAPDRAIQKWSAITATPSPMSTTFFTPGRFSALHGVERDDLPPITGHAASAAYTMPGCSRRCRRPSCRAPCRRRRGAAAPCRYVELVGGTSASRPRHRRRAASAASSP